MSPTEASVSILAIEANAWALNAPDDPKRDNAFLFEKLIRLSFRIRWRTGPTLKGRRVIRERKTSNLQGRGIR
jgi:hypothetical protein